MKDLHKYIHEAIRTFGIEVLSERRLTNILADLGAQCDFPWADTVIYAANKNGIISAFISAKKNSKRLSIEDVKRYAGLLSTRNAIWLDIAEYVLASFAYSIGIIEFPILLDEFSKMYRFDYQYCGHWTFRFNISKNKVTDLLILNDGTAFTNEGQTKYLWSLLEDGSINLSLNGSVYYQGTFDDRGNMKGFAHNGLFHWEWEAERVMNGIDDNSLCSGIWTIVNDDPDLADNEIVFLQNGVLKSKIYGDGSWKRQNNRLEILTANGFIKYIASYNHKVITGSAVNKIGNRWNFKLIKNNI